MTVLADAAAAVAVTANVGEARPATVSTAACTYLYYLVVKEAILDWFYDHTAAHSATPSGEENIVFEFVYLFDLVCRSPRTIDKRAKPIEGCCCEPVD